MIQRARTHLHFVHICLQLAVVNGVISLLRFLPELGAFVSYVPIWIIGSGIATILTAKFVINDSNRFLMTGIGFTFVMSGAGSMILVGKYSQFLNCLLVALLLALLLKKNHKVQEPNGSSWSKFEVLIIFGLAASSILLSS